MRQHLPPELSRLGDEICAAAERTVTARRRRVEVLARLAASGVAGVIAFAVLTPTALGPADRTTQLLQFAALRSAPAALYAPTACDRPRGATFSQPHPCAAPGSTSTAVVFKRRQAWLRPRAGA